MYQEQCVFSLVTEMYTLQQCALLLRCSQDKMIKLYSSPSLCLVPCQPLLSLLPLLLATVHALHVFTQQLHLVWPQTGDGHLLAEEFIHHLLGQAECVHIAGESAARKR